MLCVFWFWFGMMSIFFVFFCFVFGFVFFGFGLGVSDEFFCCCFFVFGFGLVRVFFGLDFDCLCWENNLQIRFIVRRYFPEEMHCDRFFQQTISR